MMKGLQILFILTMTLHVFGYCPDRHKYRDCFFRYQCREDLRGVSLPAECQGSINFPVSIELVLTDAKDKYDENQVDREFLASITSLRVSGKWPETNLTILEHMTHLRQLVLINDHIEKIFGHPFFHLNRLEMLDLSHNKLVNVEELFQFEFQPNRMETLSLAFNKIDDIPGYAFSELTALKKLDLSNNRISDLTEEPFLNLTALETLKLSNNQIKDLNGAVNNLQNLKHLFLRGNRIQNIDDRSIKIIYDLETFDISSNQLENIKPNVLSRHWLHFSANSVCEIRLSENQITSVPNATSILMFDRFTRSSKNDRNFNEDVLTKLNLSKNAISNIEYNAFQHLVRLVAIDLSCNKIFDFIVNPRDLQHVEYLNLSTNYISTLYFKSFLSMNNLQNLDLSHNYLLNIPDETFMNNYNLKYLNMTFNEINALENLRIKMFHPEGGILDLSNNNISRLSIPFGEGLRLTHLILHSNNISDTQLINLNYQNELQNLDLSRNYIEELTESSLNLPVTLNSLDLSYNYIIAVGPASFHRIGHLTKLRLGHNQLEKIEYGAFQGLAALENLDLSYNNISFLDSKVMMDLKSLRVLSLSFNGLYSLDYKGWLGHKFDLKVYLDGNRFSCEWLGRALSDFNNGFSKMRPAVVVNDISRNSLEGIPCENKQVGELTVPPVMADDRLLVIVQKILEVVREQNYYMKKMEGERNWKILSESNKLVKK